MPEYISCNKSINYNILKILNATHAILLYSCHNCFCSIHKKRSIRNMSYLKCQWKEKKENNISTDIQSCTAITCCLATRIRAKLMKMCGVNSHFD